MLSWIRCWSKTLPCSGRVHWQLRVGPCFFLLLVTNHPLLPIFKLCFLSHKVSRQSTGNIHHRPRSPTRDAHLPHCWLHLDTSQCPVRGWDQIKKFLVFFLTKETTTGFTRGSCWRGVSQSRRRWRLPDLPLPTWVFPDALHRRRHLSASHTSFSLSQASLLHYSHNIVRYSYFLDPNKLCIMQNWYECRYLYGNHMNNICVGKYSNIPSKKYPRHYYRHSIDSLVHLSLQSNQRRSIFPRRVAWAGRLSLSNPKPFKMCCFLGDWWPPRREKRNCDAFSSARRVRAERSERKF